MYNNKGCNKFKIQKKATTVAIDFIKSFKTFSVAIFYIDLKL